MPNNRNILDAEVVVPLKYLSNFGRSLDFPQIKCEINLAWSKECVISEILIIPRIPRDPDADPPVLGMETIQTTSATFQINNAKFYVPVVTLSNFQI